jgi:carnitine 3-dehydrogenase
VSLDVETLRRVVPAHWLDHNGHMNEARYLQAFSRASDRLLAMAGVDADYIRGGHGWFTVETHLRHLGEIRAGGAIVVRSRLLELRGRTLRAFQTMADDAGRLLATGEHLYVHVSLATRRAAAPSPEAAARLAALVSDAPWPEAAGRVGLSDRSPASAG